MTAEAATTTVNEIHADGGVVGGSRSAIGGSAAYVHVNADGSYALQAVDVYVPARTLTRANATLFISGELQSQLQAAVTPEVRVRAYAYKLESVTNNAMEMLALIGAMESLPYRWCGTVCSDSMITLGRAFAHFEPRQATLPRAIRYANIPWKLDGIDPFYIKRLREQTQRIGIVDVRLLDGHPTAEHLAQNTGKRGQPVSIHNKRVDALCGRMTAVLKQIIKEEL